MKKNIFISLYTIVVIAGLLLTACASPATVKKSEEQVVTEAKKPASEMRVAILVGTLGGDPNTDDLAAGFRRAVKEFGYKEGVVYEAIDPQRFEEDVRSFAEKGFDMIIVSWPGMIKVLEKVAPDFPDVKFSHSYVAGHDYHLPNIREIDYACWEANYVCGVAAAMISKTGKIGHIVLSEDDNIIANYNAYVKGARTINPNIVVERVNARAGDNPAKGKEIALAMYNKGIDVILGDAASTTLGIIEAAVETDNFVIGDAVDHTSYGPRNVVMDTYLGWGNAVYDQLRLLAIGEWKPVFVYSSYANDVVGTTKNKSVANNEKIASIIEDVWKKVAEVEAKIKSGELVIEKDVTK